MLPNVCQSFVNDLINLAPGAAREPDRFCRQPQPHSEPAFPFEGASVVFQSFLELSAGKGGSLQPFHITSELAVLISDNLLKLLELLQDGRRQLVKHFAADLETQIQASKRLQKTVVQVTCNPVLLFKYQDTLHPLQEPKIVEQRSKLRHNQIQVLKVRVREYATSSVHQIEASAKFRTQNDGN